MNDQMEVRRPAMHTNESGSPKKKSSSTAGRTRRASTAAAPRARATSARRPAPPVDDQIRLRAYELYLQRNGHPADPMEDWLRAERELTEERIRRKRR
jgi:hypothetical protein